MNDSLLLRLASGDGTAVSKILDRYGGLVWSLVRRFLGTSADAEDLVQEIFIDLWKSADRFDPAVSSEGNFIAMIARRRLIDRRRRVARRADVFENLPEDVDIPDEVQPDAVEVADEARHAAEAMQRLSGDQQKVLKLAIYRGLTHQEISQKTGMPLGTVKSHARRGLIRIRELLNAETVPEGGRA
ncbi:MAG: sigma-70 family RNA polymerase sigma factor [Planctomycetes bacterium]|nr:sigma-70 family RNA polymerase sigma factor [Planctomycetota bacterium]